MLLLFWLFEIMGSFSGEVTVLVIADFPPSCEPTLKLKWFTMDTPN